MDIQPIDDNPPETRPLPTPYRDVPYSADGFGAGVGSAVEQGAQVLGALAREEHAKAKAVLQEQAFGQAQSALNNRILSPQTGFAGLRGADAAGAPGTTGPAPIDGYLKGLDDDLGKIMAGVPENDRRELAWRLDRLREEGVRAAYTHESRQREVVGASIHTGSQDMAVQAVAITAANPAANANSLQQPLADIVENATKRAQAVGGKNATPEMVQAIALPDLQRAALTGMTSGLNAPGVTPARAQELFAVYGKYLGPHLGTIERAMQNLQTVDVAAQQGSALLGQAVDKRTGWVDPDRAQALLAAVPESPFKGDLTDYVMKRLNQSQTFRKDMTDRHVADVYQQAGTADDGTLDMSAVKPVTKAWMQTYASEKWTDLKRKAALENDRAQKAEDRAALPEERDNFVTAGWLMATQPEHFATMTPQQFQSEWRDKLAPKDYRALGNLWREQMASAAKETAHLPPVVLETARTIGQQAGIFPQGNKKLSGDAAEAWENLTASLIKQADQFKRTNGVPPKADDLTKMAVDHLVGVTIKGGGFAGMDKNQSALEAEMANGGALPANAEIVSVPGVPKEDVQRIKGILTGAGKAITGSAILTKYQREQARKAAGQ